MNIYGLLGEKLDHSFSSKIHNMIFEYTGIEGEYKLFPTQKEDISQLISKVKAGEIRGLNVTIPYKLEAIKYLDGVSEEAEYIGAVNTICVRKEKLIGFNTDSFGFKNTLINNDIKVQNKNVAILGTGGASKAVEFVVRNMGARTVDLFSRNPEGAQRGYDMLDTNHKYHIIINTTPVGMHPKTLVSPIDKETLGNAEAIVDIVYNPIETTLLSYAKECGIKHINGMYMLVAQAVKAQEIFNSIKIEKDITDKIYNNIIGGL